MNTTKATRIRLLPNIEAAWQDVDGFFEVFSLTAGIGAIEQVLCEDAHRLAGELYGHGGGRVDRVQDWLPRRQGASAANARHRRPQGLPLGEEPAHRRVDSQVPVCHVGARHSVSHSDACFAYFNNICGFPGWV